MPTTQQTTSRASDRRVTLEDFVKLTGGSIENAYDLLVGYFGARQRSIRSDILVRTCPKCGGRMTFLGLDPKSNPNGYTGVWSCFDEYDEDGVEQCVYEEFTTESHKAIATKYGVPEQYNAPLIDIEEISKGRLVENERSDLLFEKALAGIYAQMPRKSQFTNILPDWVRRRCPKCGNALVFYPARENKSGKTGVFACPTGWDNEDPSTWCGFEEVVDTPLDQLFVEYYHRAVDRREAARGLLLKSCPLCGNRLLPRPLEENSKGWKTRWICPTGFNSDSPTALCGYEELSTETVGSYIKKLNKMIAEG